jgi:hypothetical protein
MGTGTRLRKGVRIEWHCNKAQLLTADCYRQKSATLGQAWVLTVFIARRSKDADMAQDILPGEIGAQHTKPRSIIEYRRSGDSIPNSGR